MKSSLTQGPYCHIVKVIYDTVASRNVFLSLFIFNYLSENLMDYRKVHCLEPTRC
jgi:hypothetical protein